MALFGRAVYARVPLAASPAVFGLGAAAPARNMATLKEIQIRLKSIKNIAKITKSMKMIASTKLTRAQRQMEAARAYGEASTSFFNKAGVKAPEAPSRNVIITVSSDRGLCGAIHSSVSKFSRRLTKEYPSGTTALIPLGDKARNQLSRDLKSEIAVAFNQIGRAAPTYREAAAIAGEVLKLLGDSAGGARIQLIYNSFRSVIAYDTKAMEAFTLEQIENGENFELYEIEDEAALENLAEFALANQIYWTLLESHAAEMSSRRTAMENATKNAGEMIGRLTMTYNRSRQASITNELVDIITGASAL